MRWLDPYRGAPAPLTSPMFYIRRFLSILGLVVASFFVVIAVHLAAGIAVVWAGPLAGLAVYGLAVAAFLTCIATATETP